MPGHFCQQMRLAKPLLPKSNHIIWRSRLQNRGEPEHQSRISAYAVVMTPIRRQCVIICHWYTISSILPVLPLQLVHMHSTMCVQNTQAIWVSHWWIRESVSSDLYQFSVSHFVLNISILVYLASGIDKVVKSHTRIVCHNFALTNYNLIRRATIRKLYCR